MRRLELVVLGLLVLPACLLPDDGIVQWSDDFETCDDLCGWSFDGAASRVTTYHPGEHALRLGPRTVARHDLMVPRYGFDGAGMNFDDGNWLELTTDCAGPGMLTLREEGDDRLAIAVTLDDRALEPFHRHRVTLPPIDPTRTLTFDRIDLKTTALACRVDNLQLRISGGDDGY